MAGGAWSHTAATLSMLHNINRDGRKGKASIPADFNPYEPQKPRPGFGPITSIAELKARMEGR
jgi:hypothetical protein